MNPPKPLTPEEARSLLQSPSNRLAEKAVALIRRNGDPTELRTLIAQGASDRCVRRDPRKPRRQLIADYLLDVCFDDPGRPLVPTVTESGGCTVSTVVVGDFGAISEQAHWQRRVELFLECLALGCEPGTNGARGPLFAHVIKSCFYFGAREANLAFAKALIGSGRFDVNSWAARDYGWNGSPVKLSTFVELGGSLSTPGLLDNALRFLGCAPSGGETEESRLTVIGLLLEKGAMVSGETVEEVMFNGYDGRVRRSLRDAGLEGRVVAAIRNVSDSIFGNSTAAGVWTAATRVQDCLYNYVESAGNNLTDERRETLWLPLRTLSEAKRSKSLSRIVEATQSAIGFILDSRANGGFTGASVSEAVEVASRELAYA